MSRYDEKNCLSLSFIVRGPSGVINEYVNLYISIQTSGKINKSDHLQSPGSQPMLPAAWGAFYKAVYDDFFLHIYTRKSSLNCLVKHTQDICFGIYTKEYGHT